MKAMSPNGTEITGTLERLSGEACIVIDSFEKDEDGKLSFEHAGETKVWWDEQHTVIRKNMIVFLDESGSEFTEDQITLVEDGDAELQS